jgi:hemolysin III
MKNVISTNESVPLYSVKEELANSFSHGLGVLASIVGLLFLLRPFGNPLSILELSSYAIYGTSLILLFLSSCIYHAVQTEKLKAIFQVLDHCAIYLLIAGSYTPLLLITIKGDLANVVLTLIWTIAAAGILFKIKFGSRFEKLSLITYLGMGWCSLFIIYELWQKLAIGGFILLLCGGLIYSLGTIFYSNEKIPYNHAIWHLFVLGGACCHYFMTLFYVLPTI